MTTVNPQILRELRTKNHLTRQALAKASKVSERTLTRIESATGPQPVRKTTLQRLGECFAVSSEVLAGDEPVPELLTVVDAARGIAPGRLRALREQKGWSRTELADASGISERQIARLETYEKTARQKTLIALADALDTDVDMLGSDADADEPEPDAVRVGLRLSPQLRLAYDLVQLRYGPTRREIVELAPLLFALAAECSLAWRRQRVDKVEKAKDRMEELGKESQLYFANYLAKVDEGLWLENESIEKNDLRGDLIRNSKQAWFEFNEDHLDGVTPFADYLRKMAEDSNIQGIVDFFPNRLEAVVGLGSIWGAEPYLVCGEDLLELTGGSKQALWALAYGDVQLRHIPKDLFEPEAKKTRVKWLETRLSDASREQGDLWDFLLGPVDLGEETGSSEPAGSDPKGGNADG